MLRQPLGSWTLPLHQHHLVMSCDPHWLWDIRILSSSFRPVLYACGTHFRFALESCSGTVPDEPIPVSLISSCKDHVTVWACKVNFPRLAFTLACILEAAESLASWRHYLLEHLDVVKCHDLVVSHLLSADTVSVPCSYSPCSSTCDLSIHPLCIRCGS